MVATHTNKQRLIRTLRVKNANVIGTLSKLISTLSDGGADLGSIKTHHVGELYVVRDITVVVNDENHLAELIRKVEHLPNVSLKQVIDEVLEMHNGGKIKTVPTYPVAHIEDLRKIYTPGVAQVCSMIAENPELAKTYTAKQRNVALVTNGSRVLGLGNIGPTASLPVMEGKAALFSQLTGLNMFPILLKTRDPKKFVETVVEIASGFGAIQMEDIETPVCFEIEDELKKRLNIPVMHDDQHGTAVVALSAVINSCKLAKRSLKELKVGQIGLGAAGLAIASLIMHYTGQSVMGSDPNEIAQKRLTDKGGSVGSLEEVFASCDLVVMTTGRRDLVPPSLVRQGQILLCLSNPYPEIKVEDALKAGASYALDGTRVNNLLGYPGIFKGALDVHATTITTSMLISASEAIANAAPENDPVPNALDPRVHDKVARAVAHAAIREGVAQYIPDEDHFYTMED